MRRNPLLYVITIVLCAVALYFAYRAGQQNLGAEMEEMVSLEIEELREKHEGKIEAMEQQFSERTRELEQAYYTLREELARTGIEMSPPRIKRGGEKLEDIERLPGIVSKAIFDQLQNGMSYAEVEALVGQPGSLTFKMEDRQGRLTENYQWKWEVSTTQYGEDGFVLCRWCTNRKALQGMTRAAWQLSLAGW